MKVIFHSDEAVHSDGFRAVWKENCGGVFQATKDIKIIQSPLYPHAYAHNITCNYTIVAPDDDIIVEFTDFQLERGKLQLSAFGNTRHTITSSDYRFSEAYLFV